MWINEKDIFLCSTRLCWWNCGSQIARNVGIRVPAHGCAWNIICVSSQIKLLKPYECFANSIPQWECDRYVVGYWAPWNTLSLVCAFVPAIFAVCMFFMPESPRYYIMKDKIVEAGASLMKFRGAHAASAVAAELAAVSGFCNWKVFNCVCCL